MASLEVQLEIERIRTLIKTHGVNETARIVRRSRQNISNIKNGVRHRERKEVTVQALGITRRIGGKLCRRCGESHTLFGQSGLCIECDLLELARRGIISIEEG